MRRALRITLLVLAIVLTGLLLLIMLRFGATAPPTRVFDADAPGTRGTSGRAVVSAPAPEGVTLPDLVYFGAAWQMLNKKPGMSPIVLGAGYANARVERTDDGLFFAGIVERLNLTGDVTDVVLAFGGAQGTGDFLQGMALARGDVRDEPRYAALLFERVWNDARYAKARIHVTGHSLGAGYAQFVGTEAVARHGPAAVATRLNIVAFGVPNWGRQAARHYRVGPDVLDRLFTGYTALNDPVITNGGTDQVGVSHFLPPFTGLTGLASIANKVAAHWPTAYMTALDLPDWLTSEQKASAIRTVSDLFITGNSYDPTYGRSWVFRTIVEGTAGDDAIHGSAKNDLLAGMGGRDTLRGDGGDDRFLFQVETDSGPAAEKADEILDFDRGDSIDLSRMDADRTRPGRQAFTMVASRPFTAPAQVATWSTGATTWIAGNVDREGKPDFLIRMRGSHRLSSGDLVLVPDRRNRIVDPYMTGKAAILRNTTQ